MMKNLMIATVLLGATGFCTADEIDIKALRQKVLIVEKQRQEAVQYDGSYNRSLYEQNKFDPQALAIISADLDYKTGQECPTVAAGWLHYLAFSKENNMSRWPYGQDRAAELLASARRLVEENQYEYKLAVKKRREASELIQQLSLKAASSGNAMINGSSGGLADATMDAKKAWGHVASASINVRCFGRFEEAMCQHLASRYPRVAEICNQGLVLEEDLFE